jgi:saccharopine dehydrogenase-like NADP-dependent oxidoreductase
MRVVVLGGGVVGEAVAWDLSRVAPVAEVTVADMDAGRLAVLEQRLGVATRQADLRDIDLVERLVSAADVSVGTLPSTLALAVIERMARRGRRHVDVSFLADDPRAFDGHARSSGATIVYDCGVAPGLSHVLVGHGVRQLAHTTMARIDVGGLPEAPRAPFFYKAPFAPADVIEEYTRPARLVRDGRTIVLPALSEPETVEVDAVGPLEAFNTDGLRSLVDTVAADAMVERTLRYPGHLAAMRVLADSGFFDTTPVMVRGQAVVPRDLASAVLFPQWQYAPGERDITVLRVEVAGVAPDGTARAWTWEMVDRLDPGSPLSSMARTTGCPAAITARWLHEGRVAAPGVHPPEHLGFDGHADAMLEALAARGIRMSVSEHPFVRG